jgi:hypothetical protein
LLRAKRRNTSCFAMTNFGVQLPASMIQPSRVFPRATGALGPARQPPENKRSFCITKRRTS